MTTQPGQDRTGQGQGQASSSSSSHPHISSGHLILHRIRISNQAPPNRIHCLCVRCARAKLSSTSSSSSSSTASVCARVCNLYGGCTWASVLHFPSLLYTHTHTHKSPSKTNHKSSLLTSSGTSGLRLSDFVSCTLIPSTGQTPPAPSDHVRMHQVSAARYHHHHCRARKTFLSRTSMDD